MLNRSDCKEYLQEKVKPFDWTFTTDYMGTSSGFQVMETDERIDMEKLKRKDKILFYHDLTLFEDELHDNGIASLSVKIVSKFFSLNLIILTNKIKIEFPLILKFSKIQEF